MMGRGVRREMIGKVISDKMQKTVIVEIRNRVSHPLYKKEYVRKSKFFAHDQKDTAALGDLVRIRESRPLSCMKRWAVVEIVKTSEAVEEKKTQPRKKPSRAVSGKEKKG